VDAQTVCPGYTASNVQQTASGFTASLSLAGGVAFSAPMWVGTIATCSRSARWYSTVRLKASISVHSSCRDSQYQGPTGSGCTDSLPRIHCFQCPTDRNVGWHDRNMQSIRPLVFDSEAQSLNIGAVDIACSGCTDSLPRIHCFQCPTDRLWLHSFSFSCRRCMQP
jgi:hypothetical protein